MTPVSTHEVGDAEGNLVYRRITLRLIPFIFICYLFNYLDRVNVGFAKLQMLDALNFSETVYGLGAGIFFIGYVLCGLPSNLALNRFGPRRWISLMMITWGIFSTCLLFVTTPVEFYALRFLTGMAEAGFFPGIVLYLSRWYPNQRRGRIMALFMSAIPVSGLLGGPFSGWILNHFAAGQGGMAGWQWMFLIQGVPTVALGALAFVQLCDKVEDARWLAPEQRQRVKTDITNDELSRPVHGKSSVASVLTMPFIWILGFIYFCIQSGVYAINFWLPSIIKSLGYQSAVTVGWLSAVPYLFAALFMIWTGRSADRHGERRWHVTAPMLMGLVGLTLAANFSSNPVIVIAGLSMATMGALAALSMFWALPAAFLGSAAAAGGLALINSLGQIAGFVSPFLVGWIKDATQSTDVALYILSSVMLLGAILVLRVPARLVNR